MNYFCNKSVIHYLSYVRSAEQLRLSAIFSMGKTECSVLLRICTLLGNNWDWEIKCNRSETKHSCQIMNSVPYNLRVIYVKIENLCRCHVRVI